MSRATVILSNDHTRAKVCAWAKRADSGVVVEFRQSKRTIPQNDRMWAMLTEWAGKTDHHGVRLSPNDWKLIFMDALGQELRAVPNLDGTGFVNLGQSSSKLTVSEMSDLMELIEATAAHRGIELKNNAVPLPR